MAVGWLMPKLVVQAGAITVLIKDDRAVMDRDTLKAWKQAAQEIVESAFAHFVELPEEAPDA